jgi:tripartite-type tricarboxylate transporter receptor subunit TctC
MRLFRLGAAIVIAIAFVVQAAAHAQTYPSRVIKLIVPAGAAGPTDVLARLIADRMGAALGQPVIVENHAGGGGMMGARFVANAEPDGYTLLFGNTATLANIPAVMRNPGYDPEKNFAAVAKVMDSYQLLVVRPDFPAKTVGELVAYARANPGKLNYGAAGLGNLTNLSGELLRLKAGIDFVSVQYKSGAEFVNAVLAGDVQLAIDNVASLRALVDAGRLRALAVTSAARQPDFPAVPTMIEAGVPDYVVTSFFGVVAPAGTPAPIVAKLNAVINEALKSDALRDSLKKLGAAPTVQSAEEFSTFIAAETRKWTAIADAAHIKLD